MSDLTIASQSAIDVAMFIDWENMHSIIRGKANVSALREVAEGYGRLVVCKAYADWRETRFQQDSFVLYHYWGQANQKSIVLLAALTLFRA
ncbi:hypothetical protein ES707_03223 [subsurface metagenome]